MTSRVHIQKKTSHAHRTQMDVFTIALTNGCNVLVEVPAGEVGATTTVAYREAIEAARFAVVALVQSDAALQPEASSQPPLSSLYHTSLWLKQIEGLPGVPEGRRPSALEIAEVVRAFAIHLAGHGRGPIAANALALATVAARAEGEEGSVLAVSNRLVGEH